MVKSKLEAQKRQEEELREKNSQLEVGVCHDMSDIPSENNTLAFLPSALNSDRKKA